MWESRKRGIFSATPRHRFFRRRTGTSIRQWDKRAEAIGPLPVFFQLRNMDKRIQSDTGCLPCSQQEIFHIRQVCRFHPMFCTGIRIAVFLADSRVVTSSIPESLSRQDVPFHFLLIYLFFRKNANSGRIIPSDKKRHIPSFFRKKQERLLQKIV